MLRCVRAVVGAVECGTCPASLHQVVPTVLSGGLIEQMQRSGAWARSCVMKCDGAKKMPVQAPVYTFMPPVQLCCVAVKTPCVDTEPRQICWLICLSFKG
jgi:hypothetical protein